MYDTAHSSFRRLRQTDFATRFYDRLLVSDPRIRSLFAKTDFTRQHDLFLHGVLMLLEYAGGRPMGKMAIDRITKMHAHDGLAIPPGVYARWVESFLDAAKECDSEWSDEVHDAWQAALRPGVDRMIAGYAPGSQHSAEPRR